MTNITTPSDFFNRSGARQDSGAHPGARRHYRPDQIPSPAEMAAAWLRRRHRLSPRLAVLVAELAAIGQGGAS